MPSSTEGPGDPLEDGLLGSSRPGRTRPAVGAEESLKDDMGEGELLTDKDWVQFSRSALKAATDYQQSTLRGPWARNYRAFMNRHMSGSKYDSSRYKNRSKLFKPKTRMAVRKNDATAASAMFSTAEVTSITAENESDPVQRMTARFVNADLNYRLDRNTPMTGPSWFLTAIGARQDAQITGVCISKQYWEYETQELDTITDTQQPKIDVNGIPVVDPMTGQGVMETVQKMGKETKVLADRLMIDLLPPEMGFVDVSADWRDPIQSGGYFAAGYPVRKNDLETMIAAQASRPKMGGGAWRANINLAQVMQGTRSSASTRNETVRRAREDGQDRYESRHQDQKNGDIIWIYEWFYRYGGEDWHFWMLGETILLSDPRPTRDSYPEQKGARPYVMGMGALEAHKTHPMAPVESWQPLQMEMNDVTNLTLDAQKMAISPITKIVRGRGIDMKQVQNRGPDAAIFVEKDDDVTFDRAPGPTGSEQLQMNNLTQDFDELAGVFSNASVQANRQLNDTVGGMQIMSGAANALTEFDLRIWVETWCEPMLRQCIRAIQYFETNETAIRLAGEKAGLITVPQQQPPEPGVLDKPQKTGEQPIMLSQVLDGLDDTQILVKINVGTGAVDNKEKLAKFNAGVDMTLKLLPVLDANNVMPDAPEMMNEAWGLLGYKDGERFFREKPQGNGQPPPEIQKIMLEMKVAMQKAADEAKARDQQLAADREMHRMEMEKISAEITALMAGAQQKSATGQVDLLHKQAVQAIQRQAQYDQTQIDQQSATVDLQAQQDQHALDLQHADEMHQMKQRHADEAAAAKVAAAKAAAAAKPKPNGNGKAAP